MRRIVIIDRDPSCVSTLFDTIDKKTEFFTYGSGLEAAEKWKGKEIDFLFVDPDSWGPLGGGICEDVFSIFGPVPLICMSRKLTMGKAVELIFHGAYDCLKKPLRTNDIVRLREKLSLHEAPPEYIIPPEKMEVLHRIKGVSPKIQKIKQRIIQYAESNAPVVITGESGTGKELVAEAIHKLSPRHNAPYLAVNCASFAESIEEAILFGSVPGAFTDARNKAGAFEFCSGGSLFLDEIGEMRGPTQSKLLRTLESKEVIRLGSNTAIKVDTRIIAATNRNLKQEVRDGGFRKDLFHRLYVLDIYIPPLKERPEDISVIARHLIREYSQSHFLSTSAIRKMENYSWPGNVRELKNTIEKAVVRTPREEILAKDIELIEDM